ncbi:MAG TPA: M3 family oligoendopeptidase [Syntrophobacteraceae bacterium]|nr:M3 family oligoendopeptidase [Syntrophobacteraceae bacterium]
MDRSVQEVIWNLEDLYAHAGDPRLQEDRARCRKESEAFSRAYRGRVASLNGEELHRAVSRLEVLQERTRRLLSFSNLYFATRTQDSAASALRQAHVELAAALHRDTLFFEVEWNGIPEAAARALLEHPALASYRHYLQKIRRYQPHTLTEPEERILAEMGPVAASAWGNLFDKVLGRLRFGVEARTQSEVLSDLYHPMREIRRRAAMDLSEGLRSVLPILGHVFNTVLLDKAITDRIRRYPHWLRERNLENETDDQVVKALIDAAVSRYDLVNRYYRLKRDLLGYEELLDYDRYAPLPHVPTRTFRWDEAAEIVLSAFGRFSREMREIAAFFFDQGWIHAPVLPGKRNGAFSDPTVPSCHPYVLVNFTGTPRDVMTLAHELGHGVHQYLARQQGLFNSDTPLTMAETASVFGEMLVFRHLLDQTSDSSERLGLLCAKLEDIFATVFRQVALNRFEDRIHNLRRTSGELDVEEISLCWTSTQEEMFGNSVRLLDHYRTWWAYIPHFIHQPGYVYAYPFGELLVLSLFRQYQEEESAFVPRYLELLASGGKAPPGELLRPFEIELSDPLFWQKGLDLIRGILEEAEAQAGRLRTEP